MLDHVARDFQDERFTHWRRIIRQDGDAHASFEVHRDQHIGHHEIPKNELGPTDAIACFPMEDVLHDVGAFS